MPAFNPSSHGGRHTGCCVPFGQGSFPCCRSRIGLIAPGWQSLLSAGLAVPGCLSLLLYQLPRELRMSFLRESF